MNLSDLEAAMKTATANGQSKIPIHIFVLADLLSKAREAMAITDIERDAKQFMRRK